MSASLPASAPAAAGPAPLFPTHDLPGFLGPVQRIEPRAQRRWTLSADERATWQRDGLLILPGVFTAAEMQAVTAELSAVVARYPALADPANARCEVKDIDGQQQVMKLDPFCDLSPVFSGLARDRRITDRVAALYDGYEPRLFKDKFILKPPGTGRHGLHQDYNWWQGFPSSLLSVAIAVDGADAASGCTFFYPGARQPFRHSRERPLGPFPEALVAGLPTVSFTCAPGDIAIFDAYVPHDAGPNTSVRARRQIFLTYNDAREGEFLQAHREHFWGYQSHYCSQKATTETPEPRWFW